LKKLGIDARDAERRRSWYFTIRGKHGWEVRMNFAIYKYFADTAICNWMEDFGLLSKSRPRSG